MSLDLLNTAPRNTAASHLRQCCSSEEWVIRMLRQRPFCNSDALHAAADRAWIGLGEQDYLEAFSGHPKIGDIRSLEKKYSDLPLKEYCIKASYNSAVSGNYVNKNMLKHVLSRGCRFLDLEILVPKIMHQSHCYNLLHT